MRLVLLALFSRWQLRCALFCSLFSAEGGSGTPCHTCSFQPRAAPVRLVLLALFSRGRLRYALSYLLFSAEGGSGTPCSACSFQPRAAPVRLVLLALFSRWRLRLICNTFANFNRGVSRACYPRNARHGIRRRRHVIAPKERMLSAQRAACHPPRAAPVDL